MASKRSREQLLNDISVLERQIQAKGVARGPASAPIAPPPLPALPKAQSQPPMVPVPDPTLRDNLGWLVSDVGEVAAHTLGMAPLGLNPIGTAALTGMTLGNLAKVSMDFYEREQIRRQGTPSQRAQRAYGAGIEARIKRNAAKSARRFK